MHIVKSLPMMSLPFIPVVDVSAAERWRALDFRWSQDARSDAGVQQGTKQRYATIKGRSRGICHGKIEEQQAILGKQKWLGSVFARCGQTWVSKNPCFFWGGGYFLATPFQHHLGMTLAPSFVWGKWDIYNQQIWLRIYAPSAPWLW